MADGGPPAPQPPPAAPVPHVASPASLTHTPAPQAEPVAPPMQPVALPVQLAPLLQLNWSYFKLEFAGKPDKEAEAHLPRTNDWLDTNVFPDVGMSHLGLVSDWNGVQT